MSNNFKRIEISFTEPVLWQAGETYFVTIGRQMRPLSLLMRVKNWLLSLITALALVPSSSQSATTEVTSGLDVDIQSAINAATSGDTLNITATGSVTWTNTIDVNNKTIHFVFAGTNNFSASGSVSPLIDMTFSGSTLTRLELTSSNGSTSADMVVVGGDDWQIYGNTFISTSTKVNAIRCYGGTPTSFIHPRGIIYKNSFDGPRIYVQGDTSVQFGRYIWADSGRTYTLGGTNAVFIEDNDLDRSIDVGANMIDTDYGAVLVARYNRIHDASIQTHGFVYSSSRGTRLFEIYGNQFVQDTFSVGEAAIMMRGGYGVMWGNTIEGTFLLMGIGLDHGTTTTTYLDHNGNQAVADGSGTATSSGSTVLTDSGQSWAVNAFVDMTLMNITDGSQDTITANTATTITTSADLTWDVSDEYRVTIGYPFRDQIGVYADSALATAPNWSASQSHSPVYEWDNTINGTNAIVLIRNNMDDWIQETRDYVQDTEMPGYTPYTYPHPARADAVATPTANNATVSGAIRF